MFSLSLSPALYALTDAIMPPRETQRLVRSATYADLATLYAPCTMRLPIAHVTRTCTALLPYRTPLVSALIQEAKFYASRRAQRLLGRLLAAHIHENILAACRESDESVRLVPIPLSRARRRERGYNQVQRISEEAAAYLSRVTVTPGALTRVRTTAPQTSLNADQRLHNLVGAFQAPASLDRAYLYICIDDVLTTGATVAAAQIALRIAGLQHIQILALAH